MATDGPAPFSAEAEFVQKFKAYIDAAPTPYHLCSESIQLLKAQGFTSLKEDVPWASGGLIKPGGKYYYTRNMTTLVAFTVGEKFEAGGGFKVVGAHTDSPVLKLKPASKMSGSGYMQVAVECYGGGLWHTWFDRELSLAGCVIVADGKGGFKRHLVNLQDPLLRVPSLCIHLQSADERASFAPNKENHLQPILSMLEAELNAPKEQEAADKRHHPQLLQLLADAIGGGCTIEDIKDFELTLCDTQPGQVWGLKKEFFSSPRLDNQVHCFTSVMALLEHVDKGALATDKDVSVVVCFDHEECGSESACGAGSPVMQDVMQRIAGCFSKDDEQYKVSVRKSFLVSADVAHAIHPNYAGKHDSKHAPLLNKGTVIKTNDNQRYATNAETGFMLRELGRRAGADVQEFMVKNDCPCGTTIGPIIAAKVGVRTVDIGVPSWSMHSVRETVGVKDVYSNFMLLITFFKEFRALDDSCEFMWE